MWFKGMSESQRGWVKTKGNGFCVLVGRVERVALLHQECVAAPMEAVFDVGIGEPDVM